LNNSREGKPDEKDPGVTSSMKIMGVSMKPRHLSVSVRNIELPGQYKVSKQQMPVNTLLAVPSTLTQR
jgi:hypothetical protein